MCLAIVQCVNSDRSPRYALYTPGPPRPTVLISSRSLAARKSCQLGDHIASPSTIAPTATITTDNHPAIGRPRAASGLGAGPAASARSEETLLSDEDEDLVEDLTGPALSVSSDEGGSRSSSSSSFLPLLDLPVDVGESASLEGVASATSSTGSRHASPPYSFSIPCVYPWNRHSRDE